MYSPFHLSISKHTPDMINSHNLLGSDYYTSFTDGETETQRRTCLKVILRNLGMIVRREPRSSGSQSLAVSTFPHTAF